MKSRAATIGNWPDQRPDQIISLIKRFAWRPGDTFVPAVWRREGGCCDETGPGLLGPGLRFPGPFRDADVSEDGRTVRLFAGDWKEADVLLRKGPDGWALEAAAPNRPWVEHNSTGIRLAGSGEHSQDLTERVLLFFERSVEFKPPIMQALDPAILDPRPVYEVALKIEIATKSAFNHSSIVKIPGVDPLLVETSTGWMAFHGSAFTDLPELSAERIGEHARISRVGPLVLIQSVKGVFRLTEELSAERVETFPDKQSPSLVSITWLEVMLWR